MLTAFGCANPYSVVTLGILKCSTVWHARYFLVRHLEGSNTFQTFFSLLKIGFLFSVPKEEKNEDKELINRTTGSKVFIPFHSNYTLRNGKILAAVLHVWCVLLDELMAYICR